MKEEVAMVTVLLTYSPSPTRHQTTIQISLNPTFASERIFVVSNGPFSSLAVRGVRPLIVLSEALMVNRPETRTKGSKGVSE
jgi:hypothetical protein